MSKLIEKQVATSLKGWAKRNNILLFRLNVGILYTKWGKQIGSSDGLPDFFTITTNGYFLGIETKATAKSSFTPAQKERFSQIIKSGGKIIICHSENFSIIKEFLLEAKNNNWKTDLYNNLCYVSRETK